MALVKFFKPIYFFLVHGIILFYTCQILDKYRSYTLFWFFPPRSGFVQQFAAPVRKKNAPGEQYVMFNKGYLKMQKQYYIDFEKFSLQKLKKSLQKRNMIPSRVILKQDIEERFKILESNGIRTLKELIGALKSKQKIDRFSNQTGLTVEYLTILKREANSYHPNPIKLSKFPGIDNKIIESLEKIGIGNTKQYFNKIHNLTGTKQLTDEMGISKQKLDELASLSDLTRLYGVGPVFARILYDVGIKSVNSFIKYSSEEFIEIYENKTNRKADFSESDIGFSIEFAKELLLND